MYDSRDRLIKQFRVGAYREAYAESHINTSLASQIRILREQRGLTQKALAERLGMQQAGIARIENVNYGRWNIGTLRNIGNALDCRLKVSFETYGSLIDEKCAFRLEGLRRPAFGEDPVFSGESTGDPGGPLERLRQQVAEWSRRGSLEQLKDWLQGFSLPPFGYEEEPYVWLLRGMPGEVVRVHAARWVEAALEQEKWDVDARAFDRDKLLLNLFFLAAGLKRPEILAIPLRNVVQRQREALTLTDAVGHALQAALLGNNDDALRSQWDEYLEHDRHAVLPGDAITGFRGYCYLPTAPDVQRVVEAVAKIGKSLGFKPQREVVLNRALSMAAIFSEFQLSRFAREVVSQAERRGDGNCMSLSVLAMVKSHYHNARMADLDLVIPAVNQLGLELSPEVLAPAT